MKIDDQYECDYLPGETLVVTKLYSKTHGVVKVGSSNRRICCTHKNQHLNPELSLAHVYQGTEMRPLQKEKLITW
jgi:hypothetical protein